MMAMVFLSFKFHAQLKGVLRTTSFPSEVKRTKKLFFFFLGFSGCMELRLKRECVFY